MTVVTGMTPMWLSGAAMGGDWNYSNSNHQGCIGKDRAFLAARDKGSMMRMAACKEKIDAGSDEDD